MCEEEVKSARRTKHLDEGQKVEVCVCVYDQNMVEKHVLHSIVSPYACALKA